MHELRLERLLLRLSRFHGQLDQTPVFTRDDEELHVSKLSYGSHLGP